jgi:serine protease Do
MKHLLRLAVVASVAGFIPGASFVYAMEGLQFSSLLQDSPPFLMHANQGYLGVDIRDLDSDRVQALKLKDLRGAEIITVDHDAPAGKGGLRVHDVILQMNGQTIDNVEHLRRLLRDIPAGRSVNFLISRDGTVLNMTVQLVDRAALEQEAWPRRYSPAAPTAASARGEGFFGAGGGTPDNLVASPRPTRGIMGWVVGGSGSLPYVGATVDSLGAQLADYFGVKHGLLVRSVDDGSPAANAGLKAGDVVLKLGQTEMKTPNDWNKSLHSNQGKSVPLTVLRDHKEQILTLQTEANKKLE